MQTSLRVLQSLCFLSASLVPPKAIDYPVSCVDMGIWDDMLQIRLVKSSRWKKESEELYTKILIFFHKATFPSNNLFLLLFFRLPPANIISFAIKVPEGWCIYLHCENIERSILKNLCGICQASFSDHRCLTTVICSKTVSKLFTVIFDF